MENKNKRKKKKTGLYVVGSVVLAVGAFLVMPKIIDCLSEKMYDDNKTQPVEDDDWGPEIVKKPKEEEKTDGEF